MPAAEGSQDAEEAVAESSGEAGVVAGPDEALLVEVKWQRIAG